MGLEIAIFLFLIFASLFMLIIGELLESDLCFKISLIMASIMLAVLLVAIGKVIVNKIF